MTESGTLPAELLRVVGEALYGLSWHPEIARELNVNVRTVRRMMSGEREIKPWILVKLAELCLDRGIELLDISHILRARAGEPQEIEEEEEPGG